MTEVVRLHTTTEGAGRRIVFVHGTMTTSGQTWERQRHLADRWTVVIVDRRGYEPNPPATASDAELDGHDVAALIEPGDHIVGHSYGALGALCAAVRRRDAVRSLTLIEAPALGLVRGDPDVEARIEFVSKLRREIHDVREFHLAFATMLGAPTDAVPDPLPASLERQVRLLMDERPPWEIPLPFEELRATGMPVCVLSGGWDPYHERLCDRIAQAVGPHAERAVVPGRGHVPQRTGEPFNERLEMFLRGVEAR